MQAFFWANTPFFVQRQDVAVLALSEYVVWRGRHDSTGRDRSRALAQAIADLG
ncbi:hypothetical protein [Mesorhizobium sp. M0814]|uniref:hypothetical protein n=1 Tax=unclassified Mesorhizobium TaxID=325217 RepID=UPI0033359B49